MKTELLRGVHGRLVVELSVPAQPITERLYNQKAPPPATIISVRLEPDVFENDDFRPLTEEELSTVAFTAPAIVMRGLGSPVRHRAPNGAHFTVRDLIAAVEATELTTRGQSDWFGGVDVHHVFFQGLHLEEGDAWQISWGS